MSDGSLFFDTKIDNSGFEKDTHTLKNAMKRFVNTITSMGNSASHSFDGAGSKVLDLKGKIEQTQKQIQQLQKEMEEISNNSFESKSAAGLSKQIEQAEQKMLSLLNVREQLEDGLKTEMSSMGLPEMDSSTIRKTVESSKEWQKLSGQIQQAEAELNKYESALNKVRQVDNGADVKQTQGYQSRKIKLEQLINKLDVYKAKLGEVEQKENKAESSSKHLSNASNKTAKSIKKVGDSSNKSSKKMNGFGKSIRFALKMFGMTIMFQAFSSVINGVTEGFQNLAQASSTTNATASALMSSMTQLKNSLATAFSPILTAITPALQTLINYLITAINVIGQFFTALFAGTKTFTQAKKVQQDYAKSLKAGGSAAKKAGKDAKKAGKDAKNALQDFDELHNLSAEKESDSSGGGSGGGELLPKDMFEEVPINPVILDFIKEMQSLLKPTTEAFKRLVKAMKPFKNFTAQGAEDFYEYFLKPLAKYVLSEKGLPRVLDITTAFFKDIKWSSLNKMLKEFFKQLERAGEFSIDSSLDFYEYFLKPLAVWAVGEGLHELIEHLTKLMKNFDFTKFSGQLETFWKALAPFAISIGRGLVDFVKDLMTVGAAVIIGIGNAIELLGLGIGKIDTKLLETVGYTLGVVLVAIKGYTLLSGTAEAVSSLVGAFLKFKTLAGTEGIISAVSTSIGGLVAHPYLAAGIAFAGFVVVMDKLRRNVEEGLPITKYINDLEVIREELESSTEELDKSTSAGNEKLEQAEKEGLVIQALYDEYNKLKESTGNSTTKLAKMKIIVQELCEKVPELSGYVDTQTGLFTDQKDAIQGCIDNALKYYKAEAAKEIIVENMKKQIEVENDLAKAQKAKKDALEKLNELQRLNTEESKKTGEMLNGYGAATQGVTQRQLELQSEIGKVNEELYKYDNSIAKAKGTLQEADEAVETSMGYVVDYETTVSDASTEVEKSSEKIGKGMDSIATTSKGAMDKSHKALEGGKETLGQDASNIEKEVTNKVSPMKGNMNKAGNESVEQLGKGLNDGKKGLLEIVDSLAKFAKSKLEDNKEGFKKVGEDLTESAAAGVKKKENALADAFASLGKGALRSFENVFKGFQISIPISTSTSTNKGPTNTPYALPRSVESLPVPKLASGAVIPPKSSFLAVLGDQKRGTNIEAPLKTIEEAVRKVVGDGNGGIINIALNLDSGIVFKAIVDREKEHYEDTGEAVFGH